MSSRDKYRPGPAIRAEVQKEGERWTLLLVRELRHAPAKVWSALTEPNQLREWAPFDADRDLGQVGSAQLTTVGTPQPMVTETKIKRADKPHRLEYSWGQQELRWQLEPLGTGTRLTLWHSIDRKFISMGAAGWQICFDVLEHLLADDPLGRIVAGDAMKVGWPRLNAEYAQMFGIEAREPRAREEQKS